MHKINFKFNRSYNPYYSLKRLFKSLFIFTSLLGNMMLVFSCQKPPTISYFNSSDSISHQILPNNLPKISVIKTEDILAISIVSLSPETNQILNFNNTTNLGTSGVATSQGGSIQSLGFLVDTQGNVELPMLGKIKLIGLTLDEAANAIRAEVEKILKNPSVNVRFINHRFSILGEVANPGVYNLLNDRTTLPDALAMAGDMAQYANRANLMIFRQFGTQRVMTKIDLTNKSIFASPFFYIQDGDMIYVEPLQNKTLTIDKRIQIAPLVLSGISIISIFLNIFLR